MLINEFEMWKMKNPNKSIKSFQIINGILSSSKIFLNLKKNKYFNVVRKNIHFL